MQHQLQKKKKPHPPAFCMAWCPLCERMGFGSSRRLLRALPGLAPQAQGPNRPHLKHSEGAPQEP